MKLSMYFYAPYILLPIPFIYYGALALPVREYSAAEWNVSMYSMVSSSSSQSPDAIDTYLSVSPDDVGDSTRNVTLCIDSALAKGDDDTMKKRLLDTHDDLSFPLSNNTIASSQPLQTVDATPSSSSDQQGCTSFSATPSTLFIQHVIRGVLQTPLDVSNEGNVSMMSIPPPAEDEKEKLFDTSSNSVHYIWTEILPLLLGCILCPSLLIFHVTASNRAHPFRYTKCTHTNGVPNTLTIHLGEKTKRSALEYAPLSVSPATHPTDEQWFITSPCLLWLECVVYLWTILAAIFFLLLQYRDVHDFSHRLLRILFGTFYFGSLFSVAVYTVAYFVASVADARRHWKVFQQRSAVHTLSFRRRSPSRPVEDVESFHHRRNTFPIQTLSAPTILLVCFLPFAAASLFSLYWTIHVFDRQRVDVVLQHHAWLLPLSWRDIQHVDTVGVRSLVWTLMLYVTVLIVLQLILCLIVCARRPLDNVPPKSSFRQRCFLLFFSLYHGLLLAVLLLYWQMDSVNVATLALFNALLKYAYACIPALLFLSLYLLRALSGSERHSTSVLLQRPLSHKRVSLSPSPFDGLPEDVEKFMDADRCLPQTAQRSNKRDVVGDDTPCSNSKCDDDKECRSLFEGLPIRTPIERLKNFISYTKVDLLDQDLVWESRWYKNNYNQAITPDLLLFVASFSTRLQICYHLLEDWKQSSIWTKEGISNECLIYFRKYTNLQGLLIDFLVVMSQRIVAAEGKDDTLPSKLAIIDRLTAFECLDWTTLIRHIQHLQLHRYNQQIINRDYVSMAVESIALLTKRFMVDDEAFTHRLRILDEQWNEFSQTASQSLASNKAQLECLRMAARSTARVALDDFEEKRMKKKYGRDLLRKHREELDRLGSKVTDLATQVLIRDIETACDQTDKNTREVMNSCMARFRMEMISVVRVESVKLSKKDIQEIVWLVTNHMLENPILLLLSMGIDLRKSLSVANH